MAIILLATWVFLETITTQPVSCDSHVVRGKKSAVFGVLLRTYFYKRFMAFRITQSILDCMI